MGIYQGDKLLSGVFISDAKSAFEAAQNGGYQGTEEEFNAFLANAETVIEGKADKIHEHSDKQDKIIGTAGQFVVIGEDGYVTTKTIANAEEVSF